MLHQLAELPNVALFDFRSAGDITHNLANYADLVHHSPKIDELLFQYLRAGEYAVDRQEPDKTLDILRQQIEAYRLDDTTQ
jgi:hypothetical protein